MTDLKNKVAIECSKPLTERGYKVSTGTCKKPFESFWRYEDAVELEESRKDHALLIAELERLEAENERIREELKSK